MWTKTALLMLVKIEARELRGGGGNGKVTEATKMNGEGAREGDLSLNLSANGNIKTPNYIHEIFS